MIIPPVSQTVGTQGRPAPTIHPRLMDQLMASADAGKNGLVYEIMGPDQKPEEMLAGCSYFAPLNWYVVVSAPLREIREPARKLVLQQSLISLAVLVLALGLTIPLVGHVTGPVKALARYARLVPEKDFTAAQEDAPPPPRIRSRDEIGQLAGSLAFMEKELFKNVRALVEAARTREHLLGELDAAREIQQGILKKDFSTLNAQTGIDLFARLHAAREVGGDLYDFFPLDRNRLCMVIGDVSDKGVPAALFMAVTITLIRSLAHMHETPARLMAAVNTELSRENPNSMFVTLYIGYLDLSTGELIYANGGHNPPLILENTRSPRLLRGLSGPVVGALEESEYHDLTARLEPGQALFLYTDGVTEAMDREQNLFGEKRLLQAVGNTAQPADETVKKVSAAVHAFRAEAPQSDDITMLMLRFAPQN
jgi:sigma-B regulation protein RsbU (phosphoserine phosphatase)